MPKNIVNNKENFKRKVSNVIKEVLRNYDKYDLEKIEF